MNKLSRLVAIPAALALGLGLAAVPSASFAADGDEFIKNWAEFGAPDTDTYTYTDFQKAEDLNSTDGDMWDPGMYTFGADPSAFHAYWLDLPADGQKMMIVNGFDDKENQIVWERTVEHEGCKTGEGSTIRFEFTAMARNILPLDYGDATGANLSVKVNGAPIGNSVDLTGNEADKVVLEGVAPAATSLQIQIINDGTAYTGNDFAIWGMQLTQKGDCIPPPTVCGVWWNYNGNFKGDGLPSMDDPKWHKLPAKPNGQHLTALETYGFDTPYQVAVGNDKGNGNWFRWTEC
jgi:hypothetical protein